MHLEQRELTTERHQRGTLWGFVWLEVKQKGDEMKKVPRRS